LSDPTLPVLLGEGFRELPLVPPPGAIETLVGLAELVESWGRRLNLTGHRDSRTIAKRLVLDAAALMTHLPDFVAVADLGAGAGFPGLPLAILRPDARVFLVEARERRHHFQRHVIRELGISNVEAVRGRIERRTSTEAGPMDAPMGTTWRLVGSSWGITSSLSRYPDGSCWLADGLVRGTSCGATENALAWESALKSFKRVWFEKLPDDKIARGRPPAHCGTYARGGGIGVTKQSRVIAVVNQKGGVGKTTTAVNLAACLAASERSTLLVDLDPQGNASSAFGISKPIRQVYDALIGACVMKDALLPTAFSHLHVVPSGPDLVGAEIELVSALSRERRLESALADLRDSYELVIVDCPPSLGLLTLNALTAADSVLVPMQCEYYALEGLARLLDTVELVREHLNPSLCLEGIVLTMVDMRNNLSRQVEAEVRSHFGSQVYRTRIPRNVRLSEAPSHGKPIILYDIQSRGAIAYLRLGEELISKLSLAATPRRPPPLAAELVPPESSQTGGESR